MYQITTGIQNYKLLLKIIIVYPARKCTLVRQWTLIFFYIFIILSCGSYWYKHYRHEINQNNLYLGFTKKSYQSLHYSQRKISVVSVSFSIMTPSGFENHIFENFDCLRDKLDGQCKGTRGSKRDWMHIQRYQTIREYQMWRE